MADVQTNLNAKLVINQLEVDPRVKKALENWGNPPSGGYVAPIKGGKDDTKKLTDSLINAIAGVTILSKVISESIKQSKIVGVITDSLFKGLGLLMDLVLMPFLPAIIYWIMKWYMAIVDFGKWWSLGITNLTDPIGLWKTKLEEAFNNVGASIDSIFGAGTFTKFIEDWNKLWSDPFAPVTRSLTDLAFGITSTFDQILIGIQNAVANSVLGPILGINPVNRASENTGMPHIPKSLEEQTGGPSFGGNEVIPSGSPGNIPPEVNVMINLNGTFYTEDEMYAKMQAMVERVSWMMRIQNPSGVS